MKKKKIIIVIAGIIVLGVLGVGGYKYSKYSASNKMLEQSATLMANGDFTGAKADIEKAKVEYPSNSNIKTYEEDLQYNIDAQSVYEKAVNLEKEGKLEEAIKDLQSINPKAKQVKEKSDKLVQEIEGKIIAQNVNEAKTAINKADFTKANKFIEKISSINDKDGNIETLKQAEKTKKQELINSYVSNANKDLKNKDFEKASQNINALKKLDSNNEDLGKLNTQLANAIKNEKFYKNKYRGLGNDIKTEYYTSPYIGQVKLITSEYNSNIINNKSFISFYNAKIKPNLRHGVIYNLVNINKPGTGLIFAGAANENDEFNKGTITTTPGYLKGTVDINNPNTQYCGIHGDNIVSYMLSNHKPVPFTFD